MEKCILRILAGLFIEPKFSFHLINDFFSPCLCLSSPENRTCPFVRWKDVIMILLLITLCISLIFLLLLLLFHRCTSIASVSLNNLSASISHMFISPFFLLFFAFYCQVIDS